MTTSTFTACALVQTRTETIRVQRWDADTQSHVCAEERTETRETGRIEFLPMGEWVLVRVVRTPGYYGNGHAWEAHTREDARKMYTSHRDGKGWYGGKWEPAAATATKIVGSKEMPARRQEYSYGETAYMYTLVDFPAMTCPVLEMEPGRRCALQPFVYTTPPTPGDPYRNTRKAIQFTKVDG